MVRFRKSCMDAVVVATAVKLHKIKEMKFKVTDQFQWKQLFDR